MGKQVGVGKDVHVGEIATAVRVSITTHTNAAIITSEIGESLVEVPAAAAILLRSPGTSSVRLYGSICPHINVIQDNQR